LALAAAIAWIPLAPPEHVHEGDDHGHHRAVVHRHAEAHGAGHHVVNHDGVFDDDDAQILTLNPVFGVPGTPVVLKASPAREAVTLEPPITQISHRRVDTVESMIHGPPRAPASFRAPPPFLAL
jgi:hypothetical protein